MMTVTPSPFLSIIFPAFNEEHRLPDTLRKTQEFIESQPFPIEILVVENGSTDRTLEIARSFASAHAHITVLHEDRPGKGLAVQLGMLSAKGKYRFICDVDLSMPIEEITHFIPPQLDNIDIAIASREARGAFRIGEPKYRHFVGRVFNNMVRWTILPNLQDTQCGFKCFSAEAAQKLFPLQTVRGWTFDVEILAMAHQMGFRIVEIPIHWYFREHSKVHVLRDSITMALDLYKIRKTLRSKSYARQNG